MTTFTIDPISTALVLIDLQNGIVGRPLSPYSGAAVVKRARLLADAFRGCGATIVFVHVQLGELANLPVDAPQTPSVKPPPEASVLVAEVGFQAGDLLITKRQWGAFYGTDLDQHLRRRRITTIVLGGIATNFGVESTARAAAERSYAQIFAEDAMTSISAEAHAFSLQTVLPRIGRVRSTEQILQALSS